MQLDAKFARNVFEEQRSTDPSIARAPSTRSACHLLALVGSTVVSAYSLSVSTAGGAATFAASLVAVFLVFGVIQYHLIVALHEAYHSGLFASKRVNDGAGKFIAALLTFDFAAARRVHFLHHRNFGQASGDPDYCDYDLDITLHPGFALWGSIALRPVLRLLGLGAISRLPSQQMGVRNLSNAFLFRLVLVNLAFAACLWWISAWWVIPLWYAAMLTIPGSLARVRTLGEHAGLSSGQGIDKESQPCCARSNVANEKGLGGVFSRLEKFIVSPFAFNFHHEHHLIPSVPYSALPNWHRALEAAGYCEAHPECYGTSYLKTIAAVRRGLPEKELKNAVLRAEHQAKSENFNLHFDEKCMCCGSDIPRRLTGVVEDHEYPESTGIRFPVVQCDSCNMVYLYPRPATSELHRIYPERYYAHHLSDASDREQSSPVSVVERTLSARTKDALLQRISAIGINIPEGRPLRILDIGAGTGRQLDILKEAFPNSETHGIEPDRGSIELMKSHGHVAHEGLLDQVNLPHDYFDLIMSFHVIEHVAAPDNFLATCKSALAEGGTLLIETPNTETSDFHWFKTGYWGTYHAPRHWYLFDRKSIGILATRSGLDLEAIGYYTNAFFWCWTFHSILKPLGRLADVLFPPVNLYFGGYYCLLILGLCSVIDTTILKLTGKAGSMWLVLRASDRVNDSSH